MKTIYILNKVLNINNLKCFHNFNKEINVTSKSHTCEVSHFHNHTYGKCVTFQTNEDTYDYMEKFQQICQHCTQTKCINLFNNFFLWGKIFHVTIHSVVYGVLRKSTGNFPLHIITVECRLYN